jgi:L-fuculose-phosphate aldolase
MRLAGGRFLITPSALAYETMGLGDLVELRSDGTARAGQRKPSTEWRIHRDLYVARPEIGAIVHAHPPFSTALSAHRLAIPPFHYLVAAAGGRDIRCARYETFGTAELSTAVLEAMSGRTACLLANHGMIAVGDDLDAALKLAVEVESLARQYIHARTLGEPVLLDDAEMARVMSKLHDYLRGT